MLKFYRGNYFTVSMKVEVVDPSFFKDGFKEGDTLNSQRIDCDEFRKLFNKDLWNCIEYVSMCNSRIDKLSTYFFIFNKEPIVKELGYVIAENFLLDLTPSDKIKLVAKEYSTIYKLEYNGKIVCNVDMTLSTGKFAELHQRVLCIKSHYKNKNEVDSLAIYNLNEIISEINESKNLYSVEKDYGYRIEDLDKKIAYQVILDSNKFNTGLKVMGE